MPRDMTGPTAAEAAFYSAFSALDLDAMQDCWAPLPAVYCVHPGGPALRGPEAVMQGWREIFSSAKPPNISYSLVEAQRTPSLVVHLVEERIRPGGEGSDASLVMATNLFIRHQGEWRMLAHHASLPLMKTGKKRPLPRLH